MRTRTLSYYEIVSNLPADAVVTFRDVGWDEYEDLLEQVGEAEHLRISFDNGVLQVMTLSSEHEKYARFFERLMTAITLRLHIDILSFVAGAASCGRNDVLDFKHLEHVTLWSEEIPAPVTRRIAHTGSGALRHPPRCHGLRGGRSPRRTASPIA
jgi:hypothetical protein